MVELEFHYTNWRGEFSKRRAEFRELWEGVTQWHPEHQWFLRALDLEKGEERDFALRDIHDWRALQAQLQELGLLSVEIEVTRRPG